MNELIHIFIDNMIPVLAIAGVGLYLRRRFDINPSMISSMMFHVFSPALAFNALYTRDISGGDFFPHVWRYAGTALDDSVYRVLNSALAEYQAKRTCGCLSFYFCL